MNYYTVDGVSASTGSGGGGRTGSSSGSIGTEQSNLISLDAIQEIRVQTSVFAQEYDRTPGAQVSITSRGGSNASHGSLFGYFRNQRFNANDWFANRAALACGATRQDDFGGMLGGKFIPNRTYFFMSYKQNSLSSLQTTFGSVPSRQSRTSAAANLRPFLNAYPLPNGALLDNGAAEFTSVYPNPSEMKAVSLRLNHAVNKKMNVFLLYALTPSSNQSRGNVFSTANPLTSNDFRNETLTGSWLRQRTEETSNDLGGYSRG